MPSSTNPSATGFNLVLSKILHLRVLGHKNALFLFIAIFPACQVQKQVDLGRMVYIPEGFFLMGTSKQEAVNVVETDPSMSSYDWFEDEMPKHKVWLDGFYIDKYETTNAEFQAFLDATGYKPERVWQKAEKMDWGNYPVFGVSWNDAEAYAKWVGKRLPTEAEWEKVAKGGKDLVYPWGNKFSQIYSNCRAESLRTVGSYPPNEYGIYDLGGNVLEWCSDWYEKTYYPKSTARNPYNDKPNKSHVVRGGTWFLNCVYYSRTSNRNYLNIEKPSSFDVAGFRCAYSASK